jgi:thioredoxin 1
MAQVHEVDDSSFDKEVVNAAGPVLVDFSATWCGPCKKLEPVVNEIAGEYDGRLKVVKVDVDKAPGAAAKFDVMSVPTLILFRDGQRVDQILGVVKKRAITERVDKVL